jgi:hypothetical protein
MNKVYMVQFDYSTDDYSDIETYLFDTYEKALAKFNEIIEQEKQPEMSWVADAFKNNQPLENYELDTNIDDANGETELYWNITCKYDWYLHDFLNLYIKEIE